MCPSAILESAASPKLRNSKFEDLKNHGTPWKINMKHNHGGLVQLAMIFLFKFWCVLGSSHLFLRQGIGVLMMETQQNFSNLRAKYASRCTSTRWAPAGGAHQDAGGGMY